MTGAEQTIPFFDAAMQCEKCVAMGMRQVEGGGGVTVWQCVQCGAEQVFGIEPDGTWTRLSSVDEDDA